MNEWVNIFCIVATVFAIATLIYVVGSIIRGISRRAEERRSYYRSSRITVRNEGLLLITGLLCATSGLLLGHAIAKNREKSSTEHSVKCPFRR